MKDFNLRKYLAENRLTRTIDKLELDTSAEPTRQVVTLRGDSGNFTAKVVDGRVAFETTYPLLDLDLVGFPESNEESVRQFYDRIEQESGMEIPEKSTLIQLANELKAIGADYEFETDPSSNGIALYANIEDVKQVVPEVE